MLYLDESGQSFPDRSGRQPLFALAGVAMSPEAIVDYAIASKELKLQFAIPSDVAFHEPEMRFKAGRWSFGGDRVRQNEFDAALMQLLELTPFTVFGVGIRKDAFEGFVGTKVDPYLPVDVYSVAIQLLLERYVDYLAMAHDGKPMGRVTFESQGALEDAYHARDYVSTLLDGTQWIPGGGFRQWLETGARFVPKASGPVELADLVARDLQEWLRVDCVGYPGRWRFLSSRIYHRGDGLMGKFGVKVFPDSDIRAAIDNHRANCGVDPP
jgi:hypothetical protein